MPDPTQQRAFALEVAQKLRAAGFESLWAGGCVRDQLLGTTPKDYDVATNATPDQIRELFGRRCTLAIGAAFGVITVLGPSAAGQIEVATFRTDAQYSDGRHPDSVRFTTAEHDAERRDFTINGLFYDPITKQVVDYVNGQADLKQEIVRAIGDPRRRFEEDKLRMLRAVRFAATFNFTIDPSTMQAIQEMASQLGSVSAERIGMEIRRMLVDTNRGKALQLLKETQLLFHVLPEVAELSTQDFSDTVRVLDALHQPTLALGVAALLSFAVPDASLVGTVGRRFRYTNKEIERAAWLLANRESIASAAALQWPRLQRILSNDGATELVALQAATAGEADAVVILCRERLAWPKEKLDPPSLLDGGDLIGHGLEPGPHFSGLLEAVRDAQLNGEIKSREDALLLVDRLRG